MANGRLPTLFLTDPQKLQILQTINLNIDAFNNGVVEKTGTWDGNASTMTTSANFSGAIYPLDQINGNWNITKNSWTYVEATQNIGPNTKFMRLDKL